MTYAAPVTNELIRVGVLGAKGRMGSEVCRTVEAAPDTELVRAQGSLRGGLVLGSEDTPSRMNRIGRSELDHGRQRSLAESLDGIAAVTADEVAAVARDLLSQPLTAAVVGPFDDVDDLPAPLKELL